MLLFVKRFNYVKETSICTMIILKFDEEYLILNSVM